MGDNLNFHQLKICEEDKFRSVTNLNFLESNQESLHLQWLGRLGSISEERNASQTFRNIN